MNTNLSEALQTLEGHLEEGAIDKHAMRELELYIDNDGQLYRSQYMPILKNLSNKKKKGRYNGQLAVKAFLNLVDNGARKYVKEFGGTVRTMFPKSLRTELAKEYRDDFENMFDNKEHDFMESLLLDTGSLTEGESLARGLKAFRSPEVNETCKVIVAMHDQLNKMGLSAEAVMVDGKTMRGNLIKLIGALTAMSDGGPRYLRLLDKNSMALAMKGLVNKRLAMICRKALKDESQGKLG